MDEIWTDTPAGYGIESRPNGWFVVSTAGRDHSGHRLAGPYSTAWEANRAAHFMAAQMASRERQ